MKLIKFDKFDKPCLQSQHEIKITTNLIRTPKQSQSQTFITFKSSPVNSKKSSVHRQSTHLTQHKSQISHNHINNKIQILSQQNAILTFQECISILCDFKSTSPLLLYNKKLPQKTKEKMDQISSIVDQMLPQDSKEEMRRSKTLNQEKIQQMMKLLMQEKQQKYQAIKSGESLIKQQQEQIQSLKTRISLYRPSHDDI
ncbi:unnamed protein product (macronuclear) [Paramecium tetraurelia]|uniref:Uncharacterized protein n=1 Tax=Paramecium tetraurelia TaxID=5888 RepID=A0DJ88_PARTE|nr:uncharacterized protein GSPATT00017462001 [Paramecium tetraurelia]CAK83105.1 unnamed protein product [Paramecium tetraurelia]|eukprot:XP_001450502.1 hypothetical protein (macronuclear) [Paramecium tetraurelia strain d4-2]